MASFNSFSAAAVPYRALGSALKQSSSDIRRINKAVAAKADRIAARVIAGDLGGDTKFSGWEEAPLDMTYTDMTRDGPGIVFHPTRSGAGPTTTAQFGRGKGNASGFQGPGINKRTGVTSRTKSGKVRKVRKQAGYDWGVVAGRKRWSGTTDGKNTADKVVAALNAELPEVIAAGIFDLTNRTLGG